MLFRSMFHRSIIFLICSLCFSMFFFSSLCSIIWNSPNQSCEWIFHGELFVCKIRCSGVKVVYQYPTLYLSKRKLSNNESEKIVVAWVTNPNSRYSRRLVTAKREHVSPAADRVWCSRAGRTVDVPLAPRWAIAGSRTRWPHFFFLRIAAVSRLR